MMADTDVGQIDLWLLSTNNTYKHMKMNTVPLYTPCAAQ